MSEAASPELTEVIRKAVEKAAKVMPIRRLSMFPSNKEIK